MPGFPDVPGAARGPGPGPARAGAGPGDGPGPGRAGPRGPEVGRADGPVQPARLRGGLRLDGDPDVPGRARTGALAGVPPGSPAGAPGAACGTSNKRNRRPG